jgi:hypothetical protein
VTVRAFRFSLLTLLALFALATRAAWAAPADEIKALMEQGKAAEAYNWGKQFPDQLGNPQFDFYFGVAAVDAGHAGEGVLALERYLLTFPGSNEARLELARGYFVLGDLVRAREEFEEVSKREPPAPVQATIDRYLDGIRARESTYTPSSLFYLEAGIGFDSNVNGGVGSALLNLPNFGLVTIAPVGTKNGDAYTHLAAGGQITQPVAPGVNLFGAFHGEAKWNWTDTQFRQGNSTGTGGVSVLKNDNLFRTSLAYNTVTVEDERFRNTASLTQEWHHQASELTSVNGSLQYADMRYNNGNQVRDAELWVGGVGLRQAFIGKMQPVLQANANYGREANQRNRTDLGRDMSGLRVSLALTPAAKWGVSGGISGQESRYIGPDLLLSMKRKDRYNAADFTVSYAYTKNLSLRAELNYSDNKSNIPLYKYDRTVTAFKLRYEFK